MDPDIPHRPLGAEQALPQDPQLVAVLTLVSQPSSARVEQCANPATQAVAGTLQTPDWQVIPVAPGVTFGRAVQSCPQVPQFNGSDDLLTQLVPQVSGAEGGQLDTHCGPLDAAAHIELVPVHFVVQFPQLWASSRDVSQPSSARDEQCP